MRLFGMSAKTLIKRINKEDNKINAFFWYAKNVNLTKEAFKRGLCYTYWRAGGGKGQEMKSYFSKIDKPYLWNKDQRKAFADLPQTITLYRGVSKEEITAAGLQADGTTLAHASSCGISWTPFKQRASMYCAMLGNGMEFEDGYILTVTVAKERLKTFFWFGQNQECVFVPSDLDNVRIVGKVDNNNRRDVVIGSADNENERFYFEFTFAHPNGIKDVKTEKDWEDYIKLMVCYFEHPQDFDPQRRKRSGYKNFL